MSIPPPFRRGLFACVLLTVALSSAALTLGRSRGVALVGRPLDVSVPLTLDSPGQAGELCPEADVFHGDTRVDASRVTARVEGGGQNAVVRVRSSSPVDEPVVTIYLRLGCNEKFTRRYVLLTEEPGEIAQSGSAAPAQLPQVPLPAPAPARAPAAAAPAPAAPVTGGAATVPASPRAARAAQRSQRAQEAPTAVRGAVAGRLESALPPPQQQQQRTQPAARAAARPVTRSDRPRLKLDMVDLTAERDPQLRSSAGLAGAPSTDEQVRAQAAALWRSINAQPEDVLRDLQRVQALENDVKGLRGLVTANDRTLNDLRGQLAQARQERTLTLAAIALLALLLAAVVVSWFLRKGERSGTGDWWRRRDPAAEGGAAGASPPGPGAPGSPPGRAAEMDLRVDESMFESLKKPPRMPVMPSAAALARTQALKPVPPPAETPVTAPEIKPAQTTAERPPSGFHSSFQSSAMASMRMVKAEELVDIQQQADFFMSLGQTEQAIEVLESHIQHNTETSALVWLDLLAIYRALHRREDYEMLRGDFQRVFNAEVPAYDSTPTVSGGLEDYPRALTRIAALWPSPKVMDVIEESIFRKPGGEGAEPFDLEAYRELVMLYNLGREVVGSEPPPSVHGDDSVSDAPRSAFNETSMQPLSVSRGGVAPVREEQSRRGGVPDSGQDSIMDSTPGQTGLGDISDIIDVDSMLFDSDIDTRTGPRTTGNEFMDPQVPRPSPRLGLDIDLSAPAEPARKPRGDDEGKDQDQGKDKDKGNGIDFDLFEPGQDTDTKPGKAG